MTCFRLVPGITFLLLLSQNVAILRLDDGVETERTMPLDGHGYLRLAGEVSGVLVDATQDKESKIDTGSIETLKKPRFLCLHGRGSYAARFQKQLYVWPKSVTDKMDFVFLDAPFPLNDSTPLNKHLEWFTLDKLNNKGTYENFDQGIAYIEDFMVNHGPFDGVLGFSQGAVIAGALPGMQEQGVCLAEIKKIKYVVIISGAKFGGKLFPMPKLAEKAYSSPINIPSLHIFGETDIAKPNVNELMEAFVDPLVIYHHGGHEVPKLDEEGLKIMNEFLDKIRVV